MSEARPTDSRSTEARIIVDPTTTPVDEADAVPAEPLVNDNNLVEVQRRMVHSGPLPDPATLRGLVEIYPDTAKMIFEDFHSQSAHRRDMERTRLATSCTLALRSQLIG